MSTLDIGDAAFHHPGAHAPGYTMAHPPVLNSREDHRGRFGVFRPQRL